MTIHELGGILKEMYDKAPSGEKATMIHLFGVKYVKEIKNSGYNAKEIVAVAKLQESYQTEVQKGIKLAKYVMTK